MKEITETREEKQVRGFLNEGFTYKDTYFRPMTTRTLLILENVKSPYFSGGDQIRGMMEFLFISSTDSKEIIKLIREDNFDAAVLDFSEQYEVSDVEHLANLMQTNNEDASSALVEIIEEVSPDKKK